METLEDAPAQPNFAEMGERLYAQHENDLVSIHGREMTLAQARQLRQALCPVKPGEAGAAAEFEFELNALASNKDVILDEDFQGYLKAKQEQDPKPSHIKEKSETKQETLAIKSEEDYLNKQPSVKVVEPETKIHPVNISVEKSPTPIVVYKIPAEVLARQVLVEEVNVANTHLPVQPKEASPVVEVAEPIIYLKQVSMVPNLVANPEEAIIEAADPISIQSTEIMPTEENFVQFDTEALDVHSDPLIVEIDSEATVTETYDTVDPDFFVKPVVTLVESAEILDEVAESSPAVVAAEFMIQVLPNASVAVYDRVSAMEPEAAAEVVSHVEMITVVADRLHELVVQGKTDGEEAKQIEAFLKREYEQLLLSVGIEPTQELLENYIAYIYSEKYQSTNDISLSRLEVEGEGTHEKKLFDEQGVFAKVQHASQAIAQKFGNKLGELALASLGA